MSDYSFSFQDGEPTVTITLAPPDATLANSLTRRETFAVDTGFSDYVIANHPEIRASIEQGELRSNELRRSRT